MKGGASIHPRVCAVIKASGSRHTRTWLGYSRDSAKGCDLCQTALCLSEPQFPKSKATMLPREVARLCGVRHTPLGMEERAVRGWVTLFGVFKITFVYLFVPGINMEVRGQLTGMNPFSPSTKWALGIKFWLSGLAASTFTDEPSPGLG